MSSNKNRNRAKVNKNSSKKAMKFKTSPLIPVVAVIEVIILVMMSTYAWFATTENKYISTNLISVDPDSGLEIDFYQADKDFINIEDYLHNFAFEPATSIDGKNIFFPTTGTFKNTDSNKIVFREGTVNDINSKYISINFTLTNTSNIAGDIKTVSLSNKSYFKIKDNSGDFSGKALRMALYQNDGTSGAVRSTNLANDGVNKKTVFFRNTLGWETPCIYIWRTGGEAITGVPGYEMSKLGRDIYYFTFDSSQYQNFLFNNGASDNFTDPAFRQTVDITGANTNSVKSGTIYSCGTESNEYNGSNRKYNVVKDDKSYTSLGIIDDSYQSYPVISPGVSSGFQRNYSPVVSINSAGSATQITPAFASSFDDYLYGNDRDRNIFTIAPGETKEMSLIIWLEGTDPDCTADSYAGNKVEMNFVFSVGVGEDDTYIYRFYDQTKEYWTKNAQTYYGISYDPVIQLYDENEHRGYRMNYVASGKYWECEAPAFLANNPSAHEINFRRVNPWDEDMVWNYWYAGAMNMSAAADGTKTFNKAGEPVTLDVYSFTAFANGAPETYKVKDNNNRVTTVSNPIAHSCGGVWGKETNTEIITFVDATKDHWVRNSDDEGTSGTVTIKYTYKGKTVEYASSDQLSTMYHFIVPKGVYIGPSRPSVTFRRYYNFVTSELTAINNVEQNPNIYFHTEWNAGPIGGRFYQLGQKGTDATDNCYWGGDILYVQAADKLNGCFVQVRFTPQSGTATKYAYLKYNDNFKDDGNSAPNGYLCVIPADKQYKSYRVEKATGYSGTIQNYTDEIKLDYVSGVSNTEHAYNRVSIVSTSMDSLDYNTVYFTNNYKWSTVNVHYWGGSGYTSSVFPGTSMTYSYTNDSNQDVYVARIPKAARYLKFNGGSGANETVEIADIENGKGWYISGGSGGNCSVTSWWPSGGAPSASGTGRANLCKVVNYVNGTNYFMFELYPVGWPSRENLPSRE